MELAQESLAGRLSILNMSGLSQHELYGKGDPQPLEIEWEKLQKREKNATSTDSLGLYQRIWQGSMPGLLNSTPIEREIFYSSYLQTYIERDIREMLNRVDALVFADFIRSAASRTGQLFNVHAIAGDVGVSDDTAKRWIKLLEKSGIIFFLRPYFNNLLKRVTKTPKLYFFDTGLVAYLTRYSTPEILLNGAMNGAILENYAVVETIKSYRNAGQECYVYYFRNKDMQEIDMVLEHGGQLHPIEIKKNMLANSKLTNLFKKLDGYQLPRGKGAVLNLSDQLSAINSDNYIFPIWGI
jgi:predicted AAA+ superfamily ATPase